jgi:hypothetical protein
MLRVSAVKELPALSRMRDVGLLDCEGSSDDARAAVRPGSGCSPVAIELRSVVITWDQSIKVPDLPGRQHMLVESRRVHERRLRPQTGCLVQRLLCYPGECRHGHSAATRRRTLHRQAAAGSESPTGVHVLNPDGPEGEAARAIKDQHRMLRGEVSLGVEAERMTRSGTPSCRHCRSLLILTWTAG